MKMKPGKMEKAGGRPLGRSTITPTRSSHTSNPPPHLSNLPLLPDTIITGLLVAGEGVALLVPSPPPVVFQLSFGG